MEALLRKKAVYQSELTRAEASLLALSVNSDNAFTPSDLNDEFQLRLEELERKRLNFLTVQDALETKTKPEELDGMLEELAEIDSTYLKLKLRLRNKIRELGVTVPTVVRDHPPQLAVQLPKISLPSFAGNYTEWPSFCDLFTSLVDSQPHLSGVQKLQYLKGSLSGEPLRFTQVYQITEDNYKEVWTRLKERYFNPRVIIANHVKALFQAPPLSQESAHGLHKLLTTYQENLSALAVLQEPTHEWSTLLVHLLSEKLDSETRKQWELSISGNKVPKFTELSKFLESRSRALEAAQGGSKSKPTPPAANQKITSIYKHAKKPTQIFHAVESPCNFCNEPHSVYRCNAFMHASPQERSKMVRAKKLCFNCLSAKHLSDACHSTQSCKTCQARHHTLLHFNQGSSVHTPVDSVSHPTISMFSKNSHLQVLLSTALVTIHDAQGLPRACRALLDSGSQANFITQRLASELQLRQQFYHADIQGISGSASIKPRGLTDFIVHSQQSPIQLKVNAIVLPKIAGPIPSMKVNVSKWTHVPDLPLADPSFHQPGPIDLLLGADVFARTLSGPRLQINHGPVAIKTDFGWVFAGNCPSSTPGTDAVIACLATSRVQDDFLRKFWELEEVPSSRSILSTEEKQCEEHFSTTHYRDSAGRYVTYLPLKSDPSCLGNSRVRALKQFLKLEERFSRTPELKREYVSFMQEYERLHHLEPAPPDTNNPCFYIPHHAVLKPDSSTTKLRVVFNASAASSSGASLNDCLMVGPTIQSSLVEIMVRFRFHFIALIADIEKMYRQVRVDPSQRDLQRILWRESPDVPIRDLRLTTVTYGTSSAPFVAVRTLSQLAADEGHDLPLAASVLSEDFYVDDCISGADSQDSALALKVQLTTLLARGGFNLRKWITNMLPDQDNRCHEFIQPDATKTLGICWLPASDVFTFKITPLPQTSVSKRSILAAISRLFDPMGWLSPVILVGKLLIQQLWVAKVEWDENVPADVLSVWSDLSCQWDSIRDIQIPRFTNSTSSCHRELHGFSDASERAFGGVVYLRSIHPSGTITISLLMAKSKVAPLKQLSIPKLELCGAVVLCRLMKFLQSVLSDTNLKVFAWTDSTIVLHWLSDVPRRWKTFVANRVAEVQESFPASHWHHVSTHCNPADFCSRGASPADLVDNDLWWRGPEWLQDPVLPLHHVSPKPNNLPEEARNLTVLLVSLENSVLQHISTKFSSSQRMFRVLSYCFRFIKNCRAPSQSRQRTNRQPICPAELISSRTQILRFLQAATFRMDIDSLQHGRSLPPSSKLRSLHPFLDHDGVLRVGGRLDNSSLTFDAKHPIILPDGCHLSTVLVREAHLRLLHAGQSLLIATVRQMFWIPRIRALAKQVIFQCMTCFRWRAQASTQLMGSLPSARVSPARAFCKSGVDCAGPFSVRDRVRAGRPVIVKAYIAVFICFTTKAVHIELMSSMSAPCFIAAFKRFCARRGVPQEMFSDRGSNFVGAESQICASPNSLESDILAHTSPLNVTWHFNPAAAPHMGGLWEAGVKSIKFHLHRVVGAVPLTFEELSTVLAQVEACLNSRPLCPLSADGNDLEPLTPAHFLIGEPLTCLPSADISNVPDSHLRCRWELISKMSQTFWKRWSLEYLSRLQLRPKWKSPLSNIAIGDLVLLRDSTTTPLLWNLARIVECHPGRDALVRVVTLQARGKKFKRPITQVCRLPLM